MTTVRDQRPTMRAGFSVTIDDFWTIVLVVVCSGVIGAVLGFGVGVRFGG